MTLPSPKKHRITRPSTSPARTPEIELASSLDIQDSYEGPGHWSCEPATRVAGDTVWLPAALLAALVLLASAMRAFGGEADLKWQRPQLPQARAAATPPPVLRDIEAKPIPKVASKTRPKAYAVRQAGYTEAEGWARSDASVTPTQLESVIIRRDDQAFELAQSPDVFPSDATDPLTREIEVPFDGMPQQQEPPLETDTLPEPDVTAPGMDDFDSMMQRGDAFPRGDTPIPPPTTSPDEAAQPPLDEEPQPPTFVPDPRFEFPGNAPIAPERAQGTGIAATPEERAQAEANCEQELASIRASRITSISLEIRPTGEPGRDYPFECSIDDGTPYEGRRWAEITYMWKAAANCHKPLYFEQVHAERYGHSLPPCFQPICSGAHFFGSLVTLPYQMGLTPPNECMYPLGHYRPGNCAPYMVPAVPFTWRAAGAQAGAVVGVAGILP